MTPDILWCLSFPCFVLRIYLNRIFWKTYICWVTIVYAAWIITNGKSVKVRVGWQLSWVSKFNSTSFILINNQSSIVSLSIVLTLTTFRDPLNNMFLAEVRVHTGFSWASTDFSFSKFSIFQTLNMKSNINKNTSASTCIYIS